MGDTCSRCDVAALSGEDVGHPDDGGDVEQQLDEGVEEWGDIAIASSDDTEEHGHPHAVDDQECESGDGEEEVPAEGAREYEHEDDPDHHVVCEEERVFPHEAVDVDRQCRGQLLN